MTSSANSMPVTVARDKAVSENPRLNFIWIPYIHQSINFKKKSVLMLFDSNSEVNAIHPIFVKELGLSIRLTDVEAQKIDGIMLDSFEMVVRVFSMTDKANWVEFFEETFLVTNVSPKIVLGILFLILSSADIDFLGCELWWRTYTIKKALSTSKRVELVDKKKFVVVALNPEYETYIVYVRSVSSDALPSSFPFNIHSFRRPQIADLIAKEALTKVLV